MFYDQWRVPSQFCKTYTHTIQGVLVDSLPMIEFCWMYRTCYILLAFTVLALRYKSFKPSTKLPKLVVLNPCVLTPRKSWASKRDEHFIMYPAATFMHVLSFVLGPLGVYKLRKQCDKLPTSTVAKSPSPVGLVFFPKLTQHKASTKHLYRPIHKTQWPACQIILEKPQNGPTLG